MNTNQQILNLLNRQPLSVTEVADRLSIARNSAHQQILRLEAAGLIEKMAPSRTQGVGKPANLYRIVLGNEDNFSNAYKPVMDVMMQTLSSELPAGERLELLEKTGRAMARASGLSPQGDLQVDLSRALDAVNSLGAMAEMSCKGKENVIRCFSCPVSTLVHKEPMTCQMIAAFFSEATGGHVEVECQQKEKIVCGFRVVPD